MVSQVTPANTLLIICVGAGKTSLVEILAGKSKSGVVSGKIAFESETPSSKHSFRVGFVPQQDILPATLTVFEALLFAARLRLPESITDQEKKERVNNLLEKLGISHIKDSRIGDVTGGKVRGISGGEMRRVSMGLELVASPDVLLLDEPTSGLDSVSAARVADVLYAIAHDPVQPTPIIASIHQPRLAAFFLESNVSSKIFISSRLYQKFDLVLLLAHGRALYCGPGSFAPVTHFASVAPGQVSQYQEGYNVAEYLLEVANDPPTHLFQTHATQNSLATIAEKGAARYPPENGRQQKTALRSKARSGYAATFLTQLQYLCGREWKILKRDKTLFLTHVTVAAVLGVFCGKYLLSLHGTL